MNKSRKIMLNLALPALAICASLLPFSAAVAQEGFIGEVKFVGFNFAPRGWAKCDGQLLPINQNEALFSILGTTYGGDGRTTFALPDMRGRTPVHVGRGGGLSPIVLGQEKGTPSTVISQGQMANHSHDLMASSSSARTTNPIDAALARTRSNLRAYDSSAPDLALHPSVVETTGSGVPVNNMQPYTALNCIIALQGIFPSRS